jgi:hypothetical protein
LHVQRFSEIGRHFFNAGSVQFRDDDDKYAYGDKAERKAVVDKVDHPEKNRKNDQKRSKSERELNEDFHRPSDNRAMSNSLIGVAGWG